MGSQSILYLPHSDEFIGYQFYIHAGHWMIEATRPNGNGVLQNVPWIVGWPPSDMMSALRGSPNQPIRHNQEHQSAHLNIPSQAENCKTLKCWQCMFCLATKVHWIFLELCEVSRRLRGVILRTGLTVETLGFFHSGLSTDINNLCVGQHWKY